MIWRLLHDRDRSRPVGIVLSSGFSLSIVSWVLLFIKGKRTLRRAHSKACYGLNLEFTSDSKFKLMLSSACLQYETPGEVFPFPEVIRTSLIRLSVVRSSAHVAAKLAIGKEREL